MRRLLALLLLAVAAAPAAADVTALTPSYARWSSIDMPDGAGPVVAGDRVLWVAGTEDLRVRLLDRAAGPLAEMPYAKESPPVDLAASAELVAVRVAAKELWVVEPGRPARKLAADLGDRPLLEASASIAVAGRDVLTVERPANGTYGLVHRTLAGDRRQVPLPPGADLSTLGVAGDLFVVHTGNEAAVVNWRTGERVRTLAVSAPLGLAVASDGTVAYASESAIGYAPPGATGFGFFEAHAGGPGLALQGGRVAYVSGQELRSQRVTVVEPPAELGLDEFDLREPRLLFSGPPAAVVTFLSFDGARVGWSTYGCRMVADVAGPSATRIPIGPCLRSEIAHTMYSPSLDPRGRLRFRVRCVNAAGRRCVAELALSLSGRAKRGTLLTVERGHSRLFRMKVGPRMRKALARQKPVPGFLRVVEGDRRGPWRPLIF